MIPDEAVEALMDAAHDSGFVLKRSLACDWLEAAAPHLMAQGWDECAGLPSRPDPQANPYRTP